MEDHMITSAAHQSQDEHMTTEKQMEGEKKINLLLPISQMSGNKRVHKIDTSWEERFNCPTPEHSHLATLESRNAAVLIDAAKNFLL